VQTISLNFLFSAAVNTKVLNASAVALDYGPNFVYNERFLPVGFKMTTRMRLVSLVPALIVQIATMIGGLLLKLPFIGSFLIKLLAPPGSGASAEECRQGVTEVYAEVSTAVDKATGLVDRANCHMEFTGDPANWVTSQCVSEAALALIMDKDKLPPRSKDGFGTPAELLGTVLYDRLKNSKIRPLMVCVDVRKGTSPMEWRMYP
jgi:short subunit dehydrogenase-like uncharacterized protein